MGNFKELKVWQIAKKVAIEIYSLIDAEMSLKKDFRLKDQLTGSAVSIASNIAEGDELKTQKQSISHFYIAKGSCAELMTQLIIAKEVHKLESEKIDNLINECDKLGMMIYRLIQSRIRFNNERK